MKLTGPVVILCVGVWSSFTNCDAQNNLDTTLVEWYEHFDSSLGNDYTLVNGIRYLQIPARAEGHPFLGENRFSPGTIRIGEEKYVGTELKYDICNQQIILNYRHFSGSEQQIVLVSDQINAFTLGNRSFQKVYQAEEGPKYFQVIEGDPVSCLYFYQKELVDGSSGEYYYRYLPEKRSAFLSINGEFHPFKGKRSFIHAFPEGYQKEIRRYFKSTPFRFSEAIDTDMHNALQFCNELMKSDR